jgi:transcription elongation factor GreA
MCETMVRCTLCEDRDTDSEAAVECLFEEMRTIEQNLVRARSLARERTNALHEGVLPAGDALHSADSSATISPMKARLLKKFEDEIQQLEKELKTELPKEIKRARELGDLRENAEYHAAKERQRLVESRVSMLKKRVSEIALMNLDKIPHDRVGFGSTVHLKGTEGHTIVYQLVMPEDADPEQGMISTASPIGRALVNREEGDEVTVTTPNGSRRFEIVKLVTVHDEVGGEA